MAATISSGSATDTIDLLQKLVTWLVTRGYTSDMSQAITAGGWRAHLHKGSTYVNLAAGVPSGSYIWDAQYNATDFNSLNLYVGTGFNGANAFKDQPGGPVRTDGPTAGVSAVTSTGAITSYQFIDDGSDNILIIIERAPGIFRYLCWGQIVKYGTWTGGTYFAGSNPGYYGSSSVDTPATAIQYNCPFSAGGVQVDSHSAFLRADVDAFTGKWLCGGVATNNTVQMGWTGKSCQSGIDGSGGAASRDIPCINLYTKNFLHSSISGRIITLPIIIYGKRDAGGYSALGELPGIRLCMAASRGVTPGTDVLIGPDTWRVFNGFAIKVA